MDIVKFWLGVVLPYSAIAVFLIGMTWRVYAWRKLASPAMTLFPAPPTEAANKLNTLQEVALFKSLFKGDRVLWVLAWSFHALLALIFVGHLRVFANMDRMLQSLGMTEADIQAMSSGTGGAAGVGIGLAALLLVLRRAAAPSVREISGVADYAILLLIGAILTTGNLMRFSTPHFDLGLARSYFAGLARFAETGGASVLSNGVFLTHMSLAFLLLMLMPFSKLLHFGGIFFTHQLIRRH